jgi:RNA polymerase sigma-70 factor, ECF subfamily
LTDAAVAQSDDRLARSAGGDHSAFAEIVREYQSMVFSLAYHFLRDRAVAEELAQEVFLALHQRLGEIQSGAHLVYWLRRVATNRSIDQLRRQKARPQISLEEVIEPPSVSSAAQCSDPILSRKLASIVATLPEKARMVVVLRYQEDLEPSEISDILGMPLNTVKSHLRRSLSILREKLSRCTGGAQV